MDRTPNEAVTSGTNMEYDALRSAVTRIFAAYIPEADAAYVASCLVDAEARGVASHGIGRIPVYTKRLRLDVVNARPHIRICGGYGATAHIDGDNGMGYLVARDAMREAIERGQQHGISIVLASRSNHFGMAATYLRESIDAGLAALVLTNAPPLMPVWGGRTPFLGTSPFAFAAPSKATPIVLDMATSVVAFGKIRRAARRGEAIPSDWALDARGQATTDPNAALEGVVLPMAGPKGSGLGLMMELIAGVMSGSAFGGEVRNQNSDFENPQNVGHAFITFRPDLALPLAEYFERADALVNRAKSTGHAEGVESIVMPGEIEASRAERAKREGITVTDQDAAMLHDETMRAAEQ